MSDINGVSIPPGWAIVRLRDVVRTLRPKVLPSAFPDLKFIGMEHIEAHTTRLLATVPASIMKSSAVYFQPGDILYGRLRPYLNKVLFAKFAGLCSAEFIVLTPEAGIDARLLQYLVNSSPFVSFSSALNTGDRPRVDFDGIGDYRFAFPPSAEQQRIVGAIESYLPKLDAAVAALERVRANLKRYRASVLKAAVEGRLVPTEADLARKEGRDFEPASMLLERILAERRRRWEETELARMKAAGKPPKDDHWKSKYKEPVAPDTSTLPQLPAGWSWANLDELLCGIEAGKNFRCIERPPNDGEVGVVKVSAVTWGTFNEEESKTCPQAELANPAHLIHDGDLLFSRANTIELVGACVIAQKVQKRLMLSDKILRLRALNGVEEWILWCLRSREGRKQIEALATGNQESMRNIGQDRIRRIRIGLPPLAEMRRILSTLSANTSDGDHWASTAMASERRMQRLRQSILKWAFEGRLVDQDPNDEPASVLLERIRAERAAMPSRKSRKSNDHQTEAAK